MMHGTHINTLQYGARYTQRRIPYTYFTDSEEFSTSVFQPGLQSILEILSTNTA